MQSSKECKSLYQICPLQTSAIASLQLHGLCRIHNFLSCRSPFGIEMPMLIEGLHLDFFFLVSRTSGTAHTKIFNQTPLEMRTPYFLLYIFYLLLKYTNCGKFYGQ